MMTFALLFPSIDPVAIQIGPIGIRWYALAYIVGILLGWRLAIAYAARKPEVMTRTQVDDFLVWATVGIILGGRLGYVIFYRPGFYIYQPWEALFLWRGGMSFHGGLAGVLIASWWFAKRHKLDPFRVGDMVACVAPIGLFFGRLANFINGELWGRVSDVPWAMAFPSGGPLPRHPSQLYQAFLEGIVLFAVMMLVAWRPAARARPGFTGGVFLFGYGVARIIGELFREPDAQLGFLLGFITMGQILSLPMLAIGVWLMRRSPATR